MADTRQKILDTARRLFNERGLHRVGVRDIAREADMSAGNLSYHFATKDDLVSALVVELHEWNARAIFDRLPEDLSLVSFYRTAVTVMRHILGYRFVLLSYVDAVMASPELQQIEARLGPKRRRRDEAILELLAKNGYVDGRRIARATFLGEQAQMISSGWLNAAALAPVRRDDEAVVWHYAKVGCALLEPYCTPKGARQMREILAGHHDEGPTTAPPAAAKKRRAGHP